MSGPKKEERLGSLENIKIITIDYNTTSYLLRFKRSYALVLHLYKPLTTKSITDNNFLALNILVAKLMFLFKLPTH